MEVLQDNMVVAILGKGDLVGYDVAASLTPEQTQFNLASKSSQLVSQLVKSSSDLKALTYCDLKCIHISGLLEVLKLYPEFSDTFHQEIIHDLSFNLRETNHENEQNASHLGETSDEGEEVDEEEEESSGRASEQPESEPVGSIYRSLAGHQAAPYDMESEELDGEPKLKSAIGGQQQSRSTTRKPPISFDLSRNRTTIVERRRRSAGCINRPQQAQCSRHSSLLFIDSRAGKQKDSTRLTSIDERITAISSSLNEMCGQLEHFEATLRSLQVLVGQQIESPSSRRPGSLARSSSSSSVSFAPKRQPRPSELVSQSSSTGQLSLRLSRLPERTKPEDV